MTKQTFNVLIILGLAVNITMAQPPKALDDVVTVDDGAVITQVGDNHDASIHQSGSPQAAEIYQQGTGSMGNYAVINQHLGVYGNEGYIQQVGNDNRARLDFDGAGDNTGIVFQHGEGHNIGIVLMGESNTVDIRQDGTTGHVVGNAGLGTFNDPGEVFTWGDNNTIRVVQQGDQTGHLITTPAGEDYIQDGNHNPIDVWQEGSGHVGRLLQIGDGNEIELVQYGDNNQSRISQQGNNNYAVIRQSTN